MHKAIQAFLAGPERNSWVKIPGLRIYLRKATHLIHTEGEPVMIQCIDLASLEATKPGKGAFTRFLVDFEDYVDTLYREKAIYIENVMSDRFASFFERRAGYIACNAPDRCFLRKASLNTPNKQL